MSSISQAQITASLPERITADIRQKIASGYWAPGAALPTRRDLAKMYGVALRTIELAMAPLIAEGVVEAKGVKGTFVAPAGDRDIDASRMSALDFARRDRNSTRPLSIGVIGTWSGVHGEYTPESIGARAIERQASSHAGVSLHYVNRYIARNERQMSMRDAAEQLMSAGIDGIVAFAPNDYGNDSGDLMGLWEMTERSGVPLVIFEKTPPQIHARQVVYDDVYAGYEAALHLAHREWRSLVFLAPFDEPWIAERIKGAEQAVLSLHARDAVDLVVLPDPAQVVAYRHYSDYEKKGYVVGCELLDRLTEPIGILVCNDMVGYGLLKAASERDLQAGRDFGLIGFDDYVHSRRLGLSSVRPPFEQMGAECVLLLLRAIRGERCPQVVTLRSELVARASTMPPCEAREDFVGGILQTEMRQ